MSGEKEKLANMFTKVMAGTVTREEGAMLLNHLAREDQASTVKELAYLVKSPPPGVYPKTVLHTVILTRNKAFHDIVLAGLDHEDEQVTILVAQELAHLRTDDAREILIEHLGSEAYHVRKASAAALIEGFKDGRGIVADHLESHEENLFRDTYAQALLDSGKGGLDALLSIMCSGKRAASETAAKFVLTAVDKLAGPDVPRIFDALMVAGDNSDSALIVGILRIAAALKGRAKGFEGYVKAFSDYDSPSVREEAAIALNEIERAG